MTNLDDLFAQIPIDDIAGKLGASPDEVHSAVQALVPTLLGGIHNSAQDSDGASSIESAANEHAASGLLDGTVSVDKVDQAQGHAAVAKIFGGNDSNTVAAALGGTGGLGDVLGSLIGGASGGGGSNSLGVVLGSVLGGQQGGAIGDILGGLLGGKK